MDRAEGVAPETKRPPRPSATDYGTEAIERERRLAPKFLRPGFVRYAREATGDALALLQKVLRCRIQVSGTESMPIDGPVLFVANHFTRMETFILPYLIDRYARRNAHSLAHYKLFHGLFGDYLHTIGALSTRHPEIKHRIVEDLFTGRHDWLIYPEGSMIKNKQTWARGRFDLQAPDRQGTPHTGSAVMALQVVMYRELYRRAIAIGDHEAMRYYERRFRFESAHALPQRFSIVPINITYYPIRPGRNLIYRLARVVLPNIPAGLEEELTIEGNLLLKPTDINIHFGKPIPMDRYLALLQPALAGVRPGDDAAVKAILDDLKDRVTTKLMAEIYNRLTVNLDHIFCSGLRNMRRDRVSVDDYHRALYCATRQMQSRGSRRVHPSIGPDLVSLLADGSYPALDDVRSVAEQAGVLSVHDGHYHINQVVLQRVHGFHDMRIRNTVGVIANEFEPLRPAVRSVRAAVHAPSAQIRAQTMSLLQVEDQQVYAAEIAACDGLAVKPEAIGRPFLLHRPGNRVGVVLSHGYLAAPAEVRCLADHLFACGFSVYGVRLAGHGVAPPRLGEVAWQDWQRSFDRGYACLRAACPSVVLAGFSAGALLAAIAAARQSPAVAGLICINPALRLKSRLAALVPPVHLWNRVVQACRLPTLAYESIANVAENPDINYNHNAVAGVRQLQLLIAAARKRLRAVRCPSLILQGDADPVVEPAGARAFVAALGSERKDVVPMAFARHVIVRGEGCEVVHERIAEWLRDVTRDLRHRPQPLRQGAVDPTPTAVPLVS